MNGLSVVIPNWNGAQKLYKTLPVNYRKLIKSGINFEIIVVDDASQDDSLSVLNEFSFIKVIQNSNNLGFSKAVNKGVAFSSYDKILILSNDVILGSGLTYCLEHFEDSNVFAVSPQVRWINDGSFAYGRRNVVWDNGNFKVNEAGFVSDPCYTLFACGGSAVFDKSKFLSLGGFDDLYKPFYWEEIDLSYRAWKRGFTVIHEPRSIMYNHESGVIKSSFSKKYIKLISGRNSYLFLWKNIHNKQLINSHIYSLITSLPKDLIKLNLRFPVCFVTALFMLPKVLIRRAKEMSQVSSDDNALIKLINSDSYKCANYTNVNQNDIIEAGVL